MFVVLAETALGDHCHETAQQIHLSKAAQDADANNGGKAGSFYQNRFHNNDHKVPHFYQGVAAHIQHA